MPIALFLLQAAPAGKTSAALAAMIPIILTALAVLFAISLYNGLVRARVRTREAWSGIDVQLKRRASLIPNLVQTVGGYATHEHEVFAEVAQARGALAKAAGPAAAAAADGFLTQALGRLMAVAENYPALQAAGNFSQLQTELADTEEKVAYARQFYNQNALNYNTRIQSFPGNVFAGMFRFEPVAFFTAEPSVNEDIQVSFAKV
jgi:LemA protein